VSRSTKKNSYVTQQQRGSNKSTKRMASRAVRASKPEETPADGKAYRKVFNSWDICDWKWFSKEPKAKRK
jgi:hypothetical protein